jgi:hypothetical protein
VITNNAVAMSHGYNGYINTSQLAGSSVSNIVLSAFSHQAGPSGLYYQGQSDFMDRGSRTADQAGLYHYTTTANQAKEAGSRVDLGYHYVAVNTVTYDYPPIDTDGDGTSDVEEDLNGDHLLTSGETDWQSSADPGFHVFITEPKPGAILP